MELHHLAPRLLATNYFHLAARAIEGVGQQTEQRLVCGGVHRWRGDADAQFPALRSIDLALCGPRLQFDVERDSVGMGSDESGKRPLTPFRSGWNGKRRAARRRGRSDFPVVQFPGTLPESLSR